MAASAFDALLARLARELEAGGWPYMVIGGQAVLLYGEARLTRDVDITVVADLERLPDLLGLLDRAGWQALPPEPVKFARQYLVLPCHDAVSGLRFDFIFGFTPFEREAVSRARKVVIAGEPVRFTTPEDLIILKLFAGRARDLEDVRGILLRNPNLDAAYIEGWLRELDRDSGLDLAGKWASLRRATG